MSDLQYIALRNAPYRIPGRDKGFRVGLVSKGERVPAEHPAQLQDPTAFRLATAADLRGSVHVGYLQEED